MRDVGLIRSAVAIALVLALGTLAGACGSATGDTGATLTIASKRTLFTEEPGYTAVESVLAEVYAQALEGAGYKVVRRDNLGFEIAEGTRALEKGKISGYFDHLDVALTATLGWPAEKVIGESQKAFRAVRSGLEKMGLTALPPTPFGAMYAVGALRETAKARGLKTISDLRGQSQGLTISGLTGCHLQMTCVGGLENLYGLHFKGYIEAPGETFRALETKFTELSMVPATDGRLATGKDKFATLEDNRHLLPAHNLFLVTSPKVVREAGPKFEETIVAAQKGLTLPVIQELDAKVEIDDQTPRAVAAGYLKKIGLSD